MKYLDIELEGINENGEIKKYKLSEFKGNNIIVYFYPQDDTPVCTQEALDFNENLERIKKYAHVVGVSKNNIEEHKEFKEKYHLNFILLSDEKNKLKKAFEEQDKYITNIHRATFVLNKEGKIIKTWDKVDIDGHLDEILNFFIKEKMM